MSMSMYLLLGFKVTDFGRKKKKKNSYDFSLVPEDRKCSINRKIVLIRDCVNYFAHNSSDEQKVIRLCMTKFDCLPISAGVNMQTKSHEGACYVHHLHNA